MEEHDGHRAAHAVVAEVADEAKQVADEAKEAAEDAQQAAHVALEQSAAVAVAPAAEVEPEAKEETAAEDKSAEILEKLNGISSRLDDHESRFASLTAPKEEEPANDVIEVETEPQKEESKEESKPAVKKAATDNTGKEGVKHEQSGKAASGRHRFGRRRA